MPRRLFLEFPLQGGLLAVLVNHVPVQIEDPNGYTVRSTVEFNEIDRIAN